MVESLEQAEDTETAGETDPLMEDKDDPATFEERESGDSEVVIQGEETAIGFFGALRIPGVVEFSLCLFFAKLVSYTFLYWLPNYIHEKDHVDAEKAAVLSTIFDLGGIVGGVVAVCNVHIVLYYILYFTVLFRAWCLTPASAPPPPAS